MKKKYSLETVNKVYSYWGKSLISYKWGVSFFGYWSVLRKKAIEKLNLKKGDVVVDLACGPGLIFNLLEEKVGAKGKIIAVDYVHEMIKQCMKQVRRKKYKNITLIQEDAATKCENTMDSIDKTIRMNNLSKELRKYGFAQSSQDAIAQAGEIYGSDNEQLTAEIETVQLSKAQFNEIINKMQRLWMFKENTNQHICAMADQLVKVTDKLNELIKNISMIEMNQGVFDKKLEMLKNNIHENFREESKPSNKKNRSSEHVAESSEKEVQQHLEQPIDRNGVAPADVSIEKIFYCGIKK